MIVGALVAIDLAKQVKEELVTPGVKLMVTASAHHLKPPEFIWCHIKNNRNVSVAIVRNASGMNGFSISGFSSRSKQTSIAREPEAPAFTNADIIRLTPGSTYRYRIPFRDMFGTNGFPDQIQFRLTYQVHGLFSQSTVDSFAAERLFIRSKVVLIRW